MKGFEPSASGATTRHSNQLSYTHHLFLVRQEGFEPATYGLEVRCSIQLSYWRMPKKKAPLNAFTDFCQAQIQTFSMDITDDPFKLEALS